MEKVSFEYKGQKFDISARKCGFFSFGLMFRTRETEPCVFRFRGSTDFKISSIFVGFPFLAVWFDKDGKVMQVKIVRPFTASVLPRENYWTLLEIPLNRKYFSTVKNLLK